MKGRMMMLSLLLIVGNVVFSQEKAHAKVSVTNFNYEPISGAQIQFFDTDRDKTLSAVADSEGKFEIDLLPGVYNIRLKSVGKTRDYKLIEIPKLQGNQEYGEVQIIIQYEEETTFTLSNLHFATNKAVIQSSSYQELDELVEYLKNKPHLKIEIAGHTDSDGDENANMKLSQNRADAVKNYLIKKGISADRLIAKGYGESSPIADNSSESGKALNRRTEIHILD
ncbi:MAG: OmpA family protein [Flavobacteriales bacterium]|nr:OmpA family protein [Flavobacteriales bacterium]